MALTSEDRDRAEEIFFDLLESDVEASEEDILRLADGDRAIAAEVRSLLAASGEASTILEAPEPIRETGTGIGAYRIIGELGRGGMGTVHLAERIGDYEMEVAIKVLPPGLAGTVARERFVAERRILARLEHPGIARLLDGGWTDDGRPYIVMERVDGVPISQFVQECDVNTRLELFLQVAEAVQYAHRHLIVHRDLKPSNILVTPEGRVKLLDFGIAKLLDEDDSTESLTRTGERMLTPDYASPEQIRGEAVTTASDVYQLGVVLYEMLTGVLPFRLKGRPLVEVERTVSDTVPKAPSIRLTESEGEGRRTARALRGDLDNIIMKALRKEPEQRYPSPEAMAADVQRHLEGLPVQARGTTSLYILKKFVKRHRTAVVGASLLLLSLVAFAVVSARQARQIAVERDQVAFQRDTARRVVDLFVEVFEAAEPQNDVNRDVTVREALQAGVVRIQTDLKETPYARAAFMNVIGSAYGVIGDREQGEELLREALAIRSEMDSLGLDVAETMNDLGVVQMRAGQTREADSLLTGSLAIREARGANPDDIATTQVNLASVRERQGRLPAADSLYTLALPVLEQTMGRSDRVTVVSRKNAALLQRTMGQPAVAESLLADLLPDARTLAVRDPAELGKTLASLGVVRHERGDYEAAVASLQEAVDILEGIPSAAPSEASARQSLAAALGGMGEYELAEQNFEQALQRRRSMYGPTDHRVAGVLSNRAHMWLGAGDRERAEPAFREAVRIVRADRSTPWATRAQLEVNWGWTLLALDRHAEASTIFRGVLSAAREGMGVPNRLVFDAQWGLSRALSQVGSPEAAEEAYGLAIRIADQVIPRGDARAWRLRLELGELLAEAGRVEEAVPLLSAAADSLASAPGSNQAFVDRARTLLASLVEG
ncbi:MAG: serine/threonine protein kinase [Rhodothermales bacterium]|nr:serine/threonine protein kinase [Rhodothermales bacterium]